MSRSLFICLLVMVSPVCLSAQSPFFPLNSISENVVQRWEVKSGKHWQSIGTQIRPFSRSGHSSLDTLEEEFNQRLQNNSWKLSAVDRYQLRRLAQNNAPYFDQLQGFSLPDSGMGLWGTFYNRKRFFYHYDRHNQKGEGMSVYVNPMLKVSGGQSKNQSDYLYQNTRGISIRGDVDQKVGFQFALTENQARFPGYINDYPGLPGIGFRKSYGENAFDYFNANGSIAFKASKHIQLQFGHGNHFIGQGFRSMMLSDFGPNYLFLRAQTNVGKVNYQNIFTEFTQGNRNTQPYKKKYGAFHHLSFDVLPNLKLGAFEGVIFHDNRGVGRGFELNYLNPVIFYRFVEHQLGSPDNMVVGLDADYLPWQGVQFYGQLLFDEFRIDDLRNNPGHWANKYSYQFGGKYLDAFGINQLDLQAEYNLSRPYTYSHREPANSYTHFNQPLAHPMGANLQELIGRIRYQPFKRWEASVTVALTEYGVDKQSDTISWGGNPRISNANRKKELGNEIGQGIENQLQWANLKITYEALPNLMLDLEGRLRKVNSEVNALDDNNWLIQGGLRYNFSDKPEVF